MGRFIQFGVKVLPNGEAFFWKNSSGFGSMPLCYTKATKAAGGYSTDLCKGVLNFNVSGLHDVLSMSFCFRILNLFVVQIFRFFVPNISRDVHRAFIFNKYPSTYLLL